MRPFISLPSVHHVQQVNFYDQHDNLNFFGNSQQSLYNNLGYEIRPYHKLAFLEEFHQTKEIDEKYPMVEMECARKMPIGIEDFFLPLSLECNLRTASNDNHESIQLEFRDFGCPLCNVQ